MSRPRFFSALSLSLGLAAFASSTSSAQLFTAVDQGWYDATGFHDPANPNYFIGAFGGFPLVRDFFVFDLSTLSGTVTGATLEIYNAAVDPFDPDSKGYFSPDPFETVVIHDVTTPISTLTAGLGGVGAYQDLGSGTVFGSGQVSDADNGRWVSFTLNADFLARLTTSPAQIALGGMLSTLGDPAGFEFVFGSAVEPPLARLQLQTSATPVPEPSTYGAMGAAAVMLLALLRRGRNSV